jgi:hypothetical protein
MGMRVQNSCHGQPKVSNFTEDPFGRTSGVHDDGLLAHGIADDRAIAAKWRHRKGFADQCSHQETC